MMNRQLKIWKEDFIRYYSRTSIIMRIIIGAVLSFVIAYILINKVIKIQNAENKKLKQKFQSMEIIDDVDIQVADLKNSQRKTSMQLESLKALNANLAEELGTLSKGEIGKNILDLRLVIDRNSLRIVSEERIIPKKIIRRRTSKRKEPDTHIKIQFPSSMTCESYRFELLGSYRNLRKFFMEARKSNSLFFINNIHIKQSKEMLTDKNFNQYRALSCSFEVHVPYRNEDKKSGEKK